MKQGFSKVNALIWIVVIVIIVIVVLSLSNVTSGKFNLNFKNNSLYNLSEGVLIIHDSSARLNFLARTAPSYLKDIAEGNVTAQTISEIENIEGVSGVVSLVSIAKDEEESVSIGVKRKDQKITIFQKITEAEDTVQYLNAWDLFDDSGEPREFSVWAERFDVGTITDGQESSNPVSQSRDFELSLRVTSTPSSN